MRIIYVKLANIMQNSYLFKKKLSILQSIYMLLHIILKNLRKIYVIAYNYLNKQITGVFLRFIKIKSLQMVRIIVLY